MLSRKHFQSENFKQNSSSAKHEECPSLTLRTGSGSSRGCCSNGTGTRIVTVLCVALAVATCVGRHCEATSTDSPRVVGNGTSDIRSIRDGSVADASGSGNSINVNNSNRGAGEGGATQSRSSPSQNSNVVAANFSTVAPTRSNPSNDTGGGGARRPYYLELQDAVEGEATAKERAMYVQQLETNFAKLKRRIPIYQNEFAVHIPSGAEVADRIAHKYGFENMGQVRHSRAEETEILFHRRYAVVVVGGGREELRWERHISRQSPSD